MDLRDRNGNTLISEETLHIIKELCVKTKEIKNRYFSLGRLFDQWIKLCDKLEKGDDKP
jgi:hypothetical protein